jgi:hypothetical protein
MLREKSPKTLLEAQEHVANIEENLLDSKVDPFHVSSAKVETKPRNLNNVEPTQDFVTLLDQRLEHITIEFFQNQSLLMKKVTNLERDQQQHFPPRSQYNNN